MLKHILSNRFFNYLLIIAALILIYDQSQAQSRSKKGWLGIGIQEMTPSMSKDYNLGNRTGLLITSVSERSPADDAGLWEDDIILKFNGTDVEISEDFAACGARRSGSYVNMVQVVFPEHYLAVYRRGAGKNDQ